MAKDEFKNLGFPDEESELNGVGKKGDGREGGGDAKEQKNELRW